MKEEAMEKVHVQFAMGKADLGSTQILAKNMTLMTILLPTEEGVNFVPIYFPPPKGRFFFTLYFFTLYFFAIVCYCLKSC
jgi:hypothetical protein